MNKQDILQILKTIAEKEKADGCSGCAFMDTDEWEMPCRRCKRNTKDYWRAKDDSEGMERGTIVF